jgi:hypothetical protein
MDLHPPLSRDEIASFADEMETAFQQAASGDRLHRLVCEIGGVRLGLELASHTLVEAIRPALADIEIAWDGNADVRLCVFDSKESGIPIPEFRRPMRSLIGWRGECASTGDCEAAVIFDHGHSGPFVVDPGAGRGVVALDDLRKLPYWALAAPFRAAIAMLLQPHGIQLVHGAAIGRPDGVIFLTGYGGTGKSTTSLSCHLRGLTVLGDDYVALKVPQAPGALPTVHRVFSTLKLHPHEARGAEGKPADQEKIVLFPFADETGPRCREAPCIGFWNARLATGEASWIEPRHPDEVARIATASTGLQIPGNDAAMASLISRCAEAAPTIQQLNLGSHREGVVDTIEAFLDGPLPNPPSAPIPVWQQPDALRPVTVIIPVYNGARFVAEALQNIQSQEYPADLEIIIVDDGSTDDLDAALRDVDVPHRLLRQSNRGPAAARNAGIGAATGEWIAFQDVDDLWPQGALRRLTQDLLLHPEVPVVHGKFTTLYWSPDRGTLSPGNPNTDAFPYKINAGIFRKYVFESIGLFDEILSYGEDTEWFIRLRSYDHSIMIPDIIVHRRRHDGNMTNDSAATQAGSMAAWRKIIALRMGRRRVQ